MANIRKELRRLPAPRRRSAIATITGLILEKIGEAGEILLDSFFSAKYPEARLWRAILGLDDSYEFKRRSFAAILSQLKRQGLIERTAKQGKWHWRLTVRGRSALRKRESGFIPRPDGKRRVVCFDIPERERAKRRWLRSELMACGYEPLQKSVWIGGHPLPNDFIESLDALELRDRVHILPIEGQGTLEAG